MGWDTPIRNVNDFNFIQNFAEARLMLGDIINNADDAQWLKAHEPKVAMLYRFGVTFPKTYEDAAWALLQVETYIAPLATDEKKAWYRVYEDAIRMAREKCDGDLELRLYQSLITILYHSGEFEWVDHQIAVVNALIAERISPMRMTRPIDYKFEWFQSIFYHLYKLWEADKSQPLNVRWFDSIKLMVENTAHSRLLGKLHWLTTVVQIHELDKSKAQKAGENAKDAALEAQDPNTLFYSLLMIAYTYRAQNKPIVALNCLRAARHYAQNEEHRVGHAIEFAAHHYELDNFIRARRWYEWSLKLLALRESTMCSESFFQHKARAIQGLALTYVQLRRYRAAELFILEAGDNWYDLKDPYYICNNAFILGYLYEEEGVDLDGATGVLNHALELAEAIRFKSAREAMQESIKTILVKVERKRRFWNRRGGAPHESD